MARQFREQLEEEVQLEQARRAQATRAPETPPPADQAPPQPVPPDTATPAAPTASAATEPERPATYSHAHPTDATGASTLAAGPAGPTPSADERGT